MTDYASAAADSGFDTKVEGFSGDTTSAAYTAPADPTALTFMGIDGEDLLHQDAPYGGTYTEVAIVQASEDWTSAKAGGIDDVWFEQMIIVPNPFAFGNFSGVTELDVIIINNYRRTTVEWTSLTNNVVNTEVTLTPTNSLAYDMNPLAQQQETAVTTATGGPTLSGSFLFTFSTGSITVPVTGTRVVVFPFLPDTPMNETIQFLSEVLTSKDGSEQRYRIRRSPRSGHNFTYTSLDVQDQKRFDAILHKQLGLAWALPLHYEARPLTTAITAGDSTITVDAQYGQFSEGGLVAVYTDSENYEVYVIGAGLTTSSIPIDGTFQNSYAAGAAWVMPVRPSYTKGSLGQSFRAKNSAKNTMALNSYTGEYYGDASAFGTYNSKTYIDRPNRLNGSSKASGFTIETDRIDLGVPEIQQDQPWAKSRWFTELRLLGTTLQEVWEIRQLLHALGGRTTSFYMPTGHEDFVMTANALSGASTITVEYTDAVTQYGATPSEPRTHIQIVRTDGTTSRHQVTNIATVVAGETEQLTFTPALGADLDVEDIERIEWLTLSRLRSDTVQATHYRPGYSMFVVQTVEVPE